MARFCLYVYTQLTQTGHCGQFMKFQRDIAAVVRGEASKRLWVRPSTLSSNIAYLAFRSPSVIPDSVELPVSDPSALPRFTVQHPDYFASRVPLLRAGFARVPPNDPLVGTSSLFLWHSQTPQRLAAIASLPPPPTPFPFRRIDALPGARVFARKDTLNSCLMSSSVSFASSLCPVTFVVPSQISAARAALAMPHSPDWWLLKPSAGSCGRGIRLLSKQSAIELLDNANESKQEPAISATDSQDGSGVLQAYIERPLLIDKRKFDMRLYVLVSGMEPLRVYIHRHGIVRLAAYEYREPTNEDGSEWGIGGVGPEAKGTHRPSASDAAHEGRSTPTSAQHVHLTNWSVTRQLPHIAGSLRGTVVGGEWVRSALHVYAQGVAEMGPHGDGLTADTLGSMKATVLAYSSLGATLEGSVPRDTANWAKQAEEVFGDTPASKSVTDDERELVPNAVAERALELLHATLADFVTISAPSPSSSTSSLGAVGGDGVAAGDGMARLRWIEKALSGVMWREQGKHTTAQGSGETADADASGVVGSATPSTIFRGGATNAQPSALVAAADAAAALPRDVLHSGDAVGAKLPLAAMNVALEAAGADVAGTWRAIDDAIMRTVAAAVPQLKAAAASDRQQPQCAPFHVLGFDIMLAAPDDARNGVDVGLHGLSQTPSSDSASTLDDMTSLSVAAAAAAAVSQPVPRCAALGTTGKGWIPRVWLIEVNTKPSLGSESTFDYAVKSAVCADTYDALCMPVLLPALGAIAASGSAAGHETAAAAIWEAEMLRARPGALSDPSGACAALLRAQLHDERAVTAKGGFRRLWPPQEATAGGRDAFDPLGLGDTEADAFALQWAAAEAV